jgi:hypothetical protein
MADEDRALERLMNIVTALQQIGDVMIGEPLTGTIALGDTTVLQLILSNEYMYSFYIWSDSYFNIMEFWLSDSRGEIHSIADGDFAALAAYPDTTGKWTLSILLHEGAYSDSASYAAAVFRSKRYL